MAYSPGLFTTYSNPPTTSPREYPRRTSLEVGQEGRFESRNAVNDNEETPATATSRPSKSGQSRRRIVFQDPVAFRYLEEDPATDVVERWRRLPGYEMYVVEQWACSRTHPTFLICTYTGDQTHSILVNVLSVPSDESTWSQRLKVYFQALNQYHAREKETPLGTLMVTNLSGFPSALTVIAVPDGDIKKHREDFIVSENLKRMGCSGRAAINLQRPQPSTIAKFHHLYRTSEAVPLYQSVMELVRVCQIALVMYGMLQPTYADGLLCDVTERAVTDWWTDIGIYFYNVEPNDGNLGPTTVAALLGLLIGAFNRLKSFGSPVGKDVLDVPSMKRAVGHFQKSLKLERTRRLDRETLDRLHRATAKNASGEGWNAAKAVKSTVAELSGKGGEMVMGIVGSSRDKAGISDAETLDIERFAQVVTGPKMRWLWQGKPMKSGDPFYAPSDAVNSRIFSTDDQGNFLWTSNRNDSMADGGTLERTDTAATTQNSDGRAIKGRVRGAIGVLHPHVHRSNTPAEEGADWGDGGAITPRPSREQPARDHKLRPKLSSRMSTGPLTIDTVATATVNGDNNTDSVSTKRLRKTLTRSSTTTGTIPSYREQLRSPVPGDSPRRNKINAEMADLRDEFKADIYQNFSSTFQYTGPRSKALRRSQSAMQLLPAEPDNPRANKINRQLSFSIVERAVLDTGVDLSEDIEPSYPPLVADLTTALAEREALSTAAQHKARRIQTIQQSLIPYTENSVAHIEALSVAAADHLESLNDLYYHRLEEYQTMQATSSDLVGHEKVSLTEALRRVEMSGQKLDYEIEGLGARVQEVEDGVADFERSVVEIEAKVKELLGEEDRSIPLVQKVFSFLGLRLAHSKPRVAAT